MDKETFLVTDIKVSYQLRSAKMYYVEVDGTIILGPFAGHKVWNLSDVPVKSGPPKMTKDDWAALWKSPLGPFGGQGSEMSGSG